MRRVFKSLFSMLLCMLILGAALGAEETRSANIDVILLIDKSLSMRDAIGSLKNYAAGEIIGPILMPGDRLIVETFYGSIDRLYAGTVRSEEDKATIVRSLNAIAADGRFTDIGKALDRGQADIEELGQPDRPKYMLLLTDERQEAPEGTKYYSPDYRLKHPALQYIKRQDLGSFRAITVGYDVGARIEANAGQVIQFLTEAPKRDPNSFPEMPKGTSAGLDGAAAAASGRTATEQTAGSRVQTQAAGSAVYWIAGGVLLLAIVLAVIIIAVVKSKHKNEEEGGRRNDP